MNSPHTHPKFPLQSLPPHSMDVLPSLIIAWNTRDPISCLLLSLLMTPTSIWLVIKSFLSCCCLLDPNKSTQHVQKYVHYKTHYSYSKSYLYFLISLFSLIHLENNVKCARKDDKGSPKSQRDPNLQVKTDLRMCKYSLVVGTMYYKNTENVVILLGEIKKISDKRRHLNSFNRYIKQN